MKNQTKESTSIEMYRDDFPYLANGMVYLDNAATTQKPRSVVEAMSNYYLTSNANPKRGISTAATKAEAILENSRQAVANFIGLQDSDSIAFTYNTTDSINQIAESLKQGFFSPGDNIIVTQAEHHSNFLPWQRLSKQLDLQLTILPIDANGDIDLRSFKKALEIKTKLVAVAHITNVIGNKFPVEEICVLSHQAGALVLVDGAQAVPHIPVDITMIDPDFYVFSGHKLYGPGGIGVLYIKPELINKLPPARVGGGMVNYTTNDNAAWQEGISKFEAGTVNVAGAVGLAQAITYLKTIGIDRIQAHEEELTQYTLNKMREIDFVDIIGGNTTGRSSIISFNVSGVHPHDVNQVLDDRQIMVRSGHHCAQPLIASLGLPGTVRVSFGLYNNKTDIDRFIDALKITVKTFKVKL